MITPNMMRFASVLRSGGFASPDGEVFPLTGTQPLFAVSNYVSPSEVIAAGQGGAYYRSLDQFATYTSHQFAGVDPTNYVIGFATGYYDRDNVTAYSSDGKIFVSTGQGVAFAKHPNESTTPFTCVSDMLIDRYVVVRNSTAFQILLGNNVWTSGNDITPDKTTFINDVSCIWDAAAGGILLSSRTNITPTPFDIYSNAGVKTGEWNVTLPEIMGTGTIISAGLGLHRTAAINVDGDVVYVDNIDPNSTSIPSGTTGARMNFFGTEQVRKVFVGNFNRETAIAVGTRGLIEVTNDFVNWTTKVPAGNNAGINWVDVRAVNASTFVAVGIDFINVTGAVAFVTV